MMMMLTDVMNSNSVTRTFGDVKIVDMSKNDRKVDSDVVIVVFFFELLQWLKRIAAAAAVGVVFGGVDFDTDVAVYIVVI